MLRRGRGLASAALAQCRLAAGDGASRAAAGIRSPFGAGLVPAELPRTPPRWPSRWEGRAPLSQRASFSSKSLVSVNPEKASSSSAGSDGPDRSAPPRPDSKPRFQPNWQQAYRALIAASITFFFASIFLKKEVDVNHQEDTTLVNWSGTHSVRVRSVDEPETHEDLERRVQRAHERGCKIRPSGSHLSPNGLSFQEKGMVSLGLMDRVLHVDPERRQVTVQAGARVQELADALRPHGLTLQNFASIREQQVGGFTQVSAHGTGAGIPPVDCQVVSMRLVTPAEGTVTLKPSDGDRFYLARVGLGALGVVSEVTLQCVPAHRLLERTFVATRADVRKNHKQWLRENRHLRYMWIPYTDAVVVVTCNESRDGRVPSESGWFSKPPKVYSEEERLQPLKDLYAHMSGATPVDMAGLSATQLRDHLLGLSPLTKGYVAQVNQAEAEYWRRSAGHRVGWSDEILGFDCGGQQWVHEVALPAGTLSRPSMRDIEYVEALLELIEKHQIPAPAPIEQRWTARSTSVMSPAFSDNADDIFSWVGIIMYLPNEDPVQRGAITNKFQEYVHLCERHLMPKYRAYPHWAKLEPPEDDQERSRVQRYLRQRYPVDRFNDLRKRWDPKGILSNDWVDAVFGAVGRPAGEGDEGGRDK